MQRSFTWAVQALSHSGTSACACACVCACTALVLSSAPLGAQGNPPAPSRLGAAIASLNAEFTSVSAVRELADGRLLVVDAGERKLHVAEWSTGRVRTIGREGAGAREYASPRVLLSVPSDTSLLPDPRNGRWLVLVRDSIVALLTANAPGVRAVSTPVGADAQGHVLGSRPRIVDGLPRLDSLLLLRASRSTGRVDTLGTVLARSVSVASQGRIDPTRPTPVSVNPLAVGEQAIMYPDGWVAVARLAPYRVEWIAPSGQRVRGAPLPFEVVRVDDREKRAVLDRESRQTGRPAQDAPALAGWPATVPPFLSNALLAAPDGTVWVRRTPTRAREETSYDVVDRRGTLVRRVVMSEAERVVGFGRASTFTVTVDGDGIEGLRRHPLRIER